MIGRLIIGVGVCILAGFVVAADPAPNRASSAERGKAHLEQTALIRAFWPMSAYDNVWQQWTSEKPADWHAAIGERYGLPPAPYPNSNLPMGLRHADLIIGKGIGIDCLTCHGGRIFGQSLVGLGNNTLDIQSLFTEFSAASNSPARTPFQFSQVRGTNEAGAFSVYLLGLRNPDLTLAKAPRNLDLRDDTVGDVPAWWHFKKKKTMYHTGTTDVRSVRSLMQFMMHPLTTRREFIAAEPKFRDIQEYLLSLEAPKYPLPINADLASTGRQVFNDNCARCHGTYGDNWTYPNKIIPIDEIGTDRKRYDNIRKTFAQAYNESWFAEDGYPIPDTAGYQAPPLDGIWATAPYLHNGSVPTLAALLESSKRPKVFTRSFRTEIADYDDVNVGWKTVPVEPPPPDAPSHERRKVYDTTRPGQSNTGHTYGDDLTPEERAAVIEYLKTL